jgi:hypothetical protein
MFGVRVESLSLAQVARRLGAWSFVLVFYWGVGSVRDEAADWLDYVRFVQIFRVA